MTPRHSLLRHAWRDNTRGALTRGLTSPSRSSGLHLSLYVASLLILFTLTTVGSADAAANATANSPVQAAVAFRIKGNVAYGEGRLLSELDPWLEDLRSTPLDDGALDDVAYELRRIYERAGFPHVVVETQRQKLTDETWRITLTVVEGAQKLVRQMIFHNNDLFSTEELRAHFPWQRRGLLATGELIFSTEALDSGVNAIRLIYRLQGFLDVEVLATTQESGASSDVGVTVTITITEGPQYLLEAIDLQIAAPIDPTLPISAPHASTPDPSSTAASNSTETAPPTANGEASENTTNGSAASTETPEAADDAFDSELFRNAIRRTLSEKLQSFAQRPFTPRLPWEIAQQAKASLLEQGYFDAAVEPSVSDGQDDQKRVTLQVKPGRSAILGSIEISGNTRTSTSWLRRRLAFESGDVFQKSKFDESRRFLLGTGIFKNVVIQARHDHEHPGQLAVTVEVEEKDAIRTSLQFGWGSYELGRLGVELFHRNLLGLAWEGRARAKASFRGEQAELSLRYPFLFERPLSLRLSTFYRRFEEVSFERQEVKGTVALEFPLHTPRGDIRMSTGYQVRDEQVHDPDVLSIVEVTEDSRAALLFADSTFDTRDSALTPTRGHRLTLRSEYAAPAFGSDLSFVRLTGGATTVWSMTPEWTWVASLRSGWIRSLDSQEIPITERFFLGGARSVRAFFQDDVGPKDSGNDPIGGEAYAVANLETRFPIWRLLHGAAFFDIGSLVAENEDWLDHSYRYGPGLGLYLDTPIGPLRLDAALNIDRERGEDEWMFHVLLGHPF